MKKNDELRNNLEGMQQENKKLSQKIDNLTLEIIQMQNYLNIDAEFFIWKVLIISFLSCLSFFILGYCMYNFFDSKNTKRIESKKIYYKPVMEDEFEVSSQKSDLNKTFKKKKIKEKGKTMVSSMVNLQNQNRRFSHAVKDEERSRKRSFSVEEKLKEKKFLWGLSPSNFSKFFSKYVTVI